MNEAYHKLACLWEIASGDGARRVAINSTVRKHFGSRRHLSDEHKRAISEALRAYHKMHRGSTSVNAREAVRHVNKHFLHKSDHHARMARHYKTRAQEARRAGDANEHERLKGHASQHSSKYRVYSGLLRHALASRKKRQALAHLEVAAVAPWVLKPESKIGLTFDDVTSLMYFINEKGLSQNNDAPLSSMDTALKHWCEPCKTVWRGISQHELDLINANKYVSNRYLSASEKVSTAEAFASAYKTNTLIRLVKIRGFCYWRWIVDQTKTMDPDEDPDFLRKFAKKEAEWVFPPGIKFREVKRSKLGKFTVIDLKPE